MVALSFKCFRCQREVGWLKDAGEFRGMPDDTDPNEWEVLVLCRGNECIPPAPEDRKGGPCANPVQGYDKQGNRDGCANCGYGMFSHKGAAPLTAIPFEEVNRRAALETKEGHSDDCSSNFRNPHSPTPVDCDCPFSIEANGGRKA